MMKKLIVAGNWKLHKTEDDTESFLRAWVPKVSASPHELMLFPSAILLSRMGQVLRSLDAGKKVSYGPQNIWCEAKGAFTGETSIEQIKSIGATAVLIGHSERRQLFGETDALINKKIALTIDHGLRPVFCVGETLEEREDGKTMDVVSQQLERGLADRPSLQGLIMAYEPVWAIGTGKVATPEQAQDVHEEIRAWFKKKFPGAGRIPILYGGSVKSSNASSLVAQPDIDGFLVGGASLEAEEFAKICLAIK
jgi:triosephosphate isomerase (TIM)